MGKSTKQPTSKKSVRICLHPLDVISMDIIYVDTPSIDKFKYFLVIVDQFTHYAFTFPLKQKADAFQFFQQIFKKSEQLNHKLNFIRTLRWRIYLARISDFQNQ
jgi:hypothetical protein